ncbi:MAG: hypothetical protein OJF55_001037 [Rhodanobacteraceae bacterium]|jgi:pilus assembly protein FimV|nr:MAG: hypothetical protein OJF55_001037 [Rhodanobacteraceae bacterium]
MKLKLRILCAALLVASTAPAWALQLGQIQVKSALNQPLVAAIPLHPENLTELEGLTVGLAPAADYARAGLQITPTDQTLRFSVVTDNNGQKLLLVTSTQPITDPYLDFLLQVNTRQGRQVREFVVLLNPVIAAPAPEVQAAPVASTPPASVQAPAELPPASAFPQPASTSAPKPVAESKPEQPVAAASAPQKTAPSPQPKPLPQPAARAAGGTVKVEKGDTLYVIAQREVEGSRASINQMMLALKTVNPDAFFKDNINDLKSGAILRIPTRDEIDRTSVAEANAEVHRQYEAWRAARPQSATVLAGTAAAAAANAAPKPETTAPQSDHLALTPPTGAGGGARNRTGVAGGTGKETVSGLQQQLQNDRSALVSLEQANADLESRVRSLKDLTSKSDKLLSLKDATVAELQRKLAEVQSGKSRAAGAAPIAGASAGAAASKPAVAPAASAQAGAKSAANKPAAEPRVGGEPWFARPLTWIMAGLIVLALIVLGLLRRRRGGTAVPTTKGPLPDPADVTPPQPEPPDEEAALRAEIAAHPGNLAAHLALCRLIHARGDEPAFIAAAKAMRAHVDDLHGAEWHEVTEMGEELAPHLPLFEVPPATHDYPMSVVAAPPRVGEPEAGEALHAEVGPEPAHDESHVVDGPFASPEASSEAAEESLPESEFADDPVDTKLDLARAYLDMGDPVGARAMLEEVLEEGSQTQKDEAKRLLADVSG